MIILYHVGTIEGYFQSEKTDDLLYNVCELCLEHCQGGEIRWMEHSC